MNPVVLLHDQGHGAPLIDALARFGAGLPANVLPVAVNEITQLGVEAWTAPFAWGASAVRALGPARPKHDTPGLARSIAIANLLTGSLHWVIQVIHLLLGLGLLGLADTLATRAKARLAPVA